MVWIVATLSVLGAALPSWAAVSVYRRARADDGERRAVVAERDAPAMTNSDAARFLDQTWTEPSRRMLVARVDLVRVVAGFACTAAASIIAAVAAA